MQRNLLCVSLLFALSGTAASQAQPPVPMRMPMKQQVLESQLRSSLSPEAADAKSVPAQAVKLAALSAPRVATSAPLPNQKINAPHLDSIQTLPGTRPFVNTSHGDASIAVDGQRMVAAFSASGTQVVPAAGGGFTVQRNLRIGYAYSHNGGTTWSSAYLPPLPGSHSTGNGVDITGAGYGIVDVDRRGFFFIGSIGTNAQGKRAVTVNVSTNGGQSFARVQEIESAGLFDLATLAIGPHPAKPRTDNIYLAWPSYEEDVLPPTSAVLRFARSTDGGLTYEKKTIFVPTADPANPSHPQRQLQFPSIAVDKFSGKLYIAFVNFGHVNDDYLRLLVSEDGGETFHPVKFDKAGAPNPEVYPVVQPGTLVSCGTFRDGRPHSTLALHAGESQGPDPRFNPALPRYVQASQVLLQPVLAVSKGVIHLAWSQADSGLWGDPNSGASIRYLRSTDDGASWDPVRIVNAPGAPMERNVAPRIAIGRSQHEAADPTKLSPKDIHIAYYTQRADGQVVVNLAQSDDRGESFPAALHRQVSNQAFALSPSNIPLPTTQDAFHTTHYNRLKRTCTSLGDYMGLATGEGVVHAVWGDTRNPIQQPESEFDPISGQRHPKEDVFHAAPRIR